MVEAIARDTEEVLRTGKAYDAEEIFAYLVAKVQGPGTCLLLISSRNDSRLLSISAIRGSTMSTLTIDLSPETYQRLEEQARRTGQAPETLSREILETALEMRETARPRTTREVLQTVASTRSLSPTLRSRIIPGVTLDEVRQILAQAAGPTLGDVIREHRGPKA